MFLLIFLIKLIIWACKIIWAWVYPWLDYAYHQLRADLVFAPWLVFYMYKSPLCFSIIVWVVSLLSSFLLFTLSVQMYFFFHTYYWLVLKKNKLIYRGCDIWTAEAPVWSFFRYFLFVEPRMRGQARSIKLIRREKGIPLIPLALILLILLLVRCTIGAPLTVLRSATLGSSLADDMVDEDEFTWEGWAYKFVILSARLVARDIPLDLRTLPKQTVEDEDKCAE